MKRLLLALVAALPVASPAWAASPAVGSAAAGSPAAPPSMAGAFLSLLYPGGGQFYAGDPVRGDVYLGLGLGGGLLGFGAIIFQVPGASLTAEETALAGLVGYGVMLAIEGASTLDALIEIGSEQNDALAPPPTAALAAENAAPAPLTAASLPPTAAPPPPEVRSLVVPIPPPARPVVVLPPVAASSEVHAALPPLAARGAPQASPIDTDSEHILHAYALADQGDPIGAIAELAAVRSPAFAPKIEALTEEWTTPAAAELVAAANRLAWQGKIQEAIATLDKALSLPADPAVRKGAQRLRERLEKMLSETREGAPDDHPAP